MKDEEMAEEYAKAHIVQYPKRVIISENGFCTSEDEVKQGFLAGLKAGRPQWHTDPNDLPPMVQDERHISERVWINVENWGTEDGYYDYKRNCWIIRCRIVNLPILAWCEIPTFDKE